MDAPKRGKKYKEILAKGCGLHYYPYEGDYDCDHGYTWDCDKCPCAMEDKKHLKEMTNFKEKI